MSKNSASPYQQFLNYIKKNKFTPRERNGQVIITLQYQPPIRTTLTYTEDFPRPDDTDYTLQIATICPDPSALATGAYKHRTPLTTLHFSQNTPITKAIDDIKKEAYLD